jgi:acyl-CoA reductase-like NAD-dependent aldehyde dehydrogenase
MLSAQDAAERAAGPQPLWALVPPAARARYLRRAAQAILDEVDELADLLAARSAVPRTEALLAELLPSVGGLHGLAEDGPDVLRDRRLGRMPVLRAGRRSVLFHDPLGVVGIRGGGGSPWAEPLLDTAAALLAGNGVVLVPAQPEVGERMAAALGRAGIPEGLLQVAADDFGLADTCAFVHLLEPPVRKATMVVLDGAPLDRTVNGALWAAFARSGRGPAAVGRLLVVPSAAEGLLRKLEAGARRLRVGDPRAADTEVGPLASEADLACVEELVAEAVAGGATLVCGGRVEGDAPFYAPAVLRGVAPDARLLREPVPGPVLAVVGVASEADAIANARVGARAISVWTGDTAQGERVARSLRAEVAWVNEHGTAASATPVRLGRYASPRQLASQPAGLRSARWLPHDPVLVRASTSIARLMHGRESERMASLRSGAVPLARMALRLARDAARR